MLSEAVKDKQAFTQNDSDEIESFDINRLTSYQTQLDEEEPDEGQEDIPSEDPPQIVIDRPVDPKPNSKLLVSRHIQALKALGSQILDSHDSNQLLTFQDVRLTSQTSQGSTGELVPQVGEPYIEMLSFTDVEALRKYERRALTGDQGSQGVSKFYITPRGLLGSQRTSGKGDVLFGRPGEEGACNDVELPSSDLGVSRVHSRLFY